MPTPPEDCWLHPAVVTGPSDIAGTGLFAIEPIPAGTEVARYGGHLVTVAELTDDAASLVVGDDLHLVLPPDTDLRFANHSCDPSTGWSDGYTLATLRDLAPGDEVTHDYATSIADPAYLLRCHCETYRCRQMVEGTDWRIPQLQRRYAGHWTPYLQGLVSAAAG
ncbi:MAG: uncharacterized protein QOH37_2618 [Nocardioidaceae bacterium]|nr:uncharacterized protein [Nocardioidaceae bacterium]